MFLAIRKSDYSRESYILVYPIRLNLDSTYIPKYVLDNVIYDNNLR